MYILSSAVTDNDAPAVADEVTKFITDAKGTILAQDLMGKKKLAYPIKKTRNGFYILQTFNLEGAHLPGLDNKLRSLEPIIRYLVVNVEEQERRAEKDRKVQEKMRASRKPVKAEPGREIKMSETELESKIEKALESEDLAK